MTVNYNYLVANSSVLNRVRLLLRWHGSLWKSVFAELFVWCGGYLAMALVYHLALKDHQQLMYDEYAKLLDQKMKLIPLDFMLGFFVSIIVNRWTTVMCSLGFIDNTALAIAFHIRGVSETARMIRRNIVRYCVISQVMVFRDVSVQVRKRFPTLPTVVAGKFMTKDELNKWENYDKSYTIAKYWMPLMWAQNAIHAAKEEGLVDSDIYMTNLQAAILAWRKNLATVSNQDWVPVPLMYPQLVFLAVHTYFFLCIFCRQFRHGELTFTEGKMSGDHEKTDFFNLIMTILQFIFYVGWMRVAEGLLNPFGEDDDDFETNYLLDRNLKVGLAIVDRGYEYNPALVKDELWEGNGDLLYSEDSRPVNPFCGSATALDIPMDRREVRMVPLDGGENDGSCPIQRRPSKYNSRFPVVEVKQGDRNGHPSMSTNLYNNIRRRFSSNQIPAFDGVSIHGEPKTPKTPSSFSLASTFEMTPSAYNNPVLDMTSEQNAKPVTLTDISNTMETSLDQPSTWDPHEIIDDVIVEEENEKSIGKSNGYTKF